MVRSYRLPGKEIVSTEQCVNHTLIFGWIKLSRYDVLISEL